MTIDCLVEKKNMTPKRKLVFTFSFDVTLLYVCYISMLFLKYGTYIS